MKKILYITTISGFLPQFEKNDVKIMQEMGYEIHYASNFRNPVYTFDTRDLEKQGIRLHHINVAKSPAKIGCNCRAIRQLKKIIDEERITIVHCHNPMGGVAGRIAAHMSKLKPYVIYTAHGLHFYRGAPLRNWLFYYPVERFLARWTDSIVTINREDYCLVRDKFRLKQGGMVSQIHGVGVDMNRFQPNPDIRIRKREALDIPEKAFHIVTAAELNGNKNHKIIIQAIAKANKNDIFYSICGKGTNENQLKEMICEYHLEKQIRLLGFRTDMEEILQTADVFAFPSIREGLGIAAVEALACGVPLIVADNRGTREYAEDGYNAIVCGADDEIAFTAAIKKLYSVDAYRNMLATHCRECARRFSTEETTGAMRRIYQVADEHCS